MVLILKIGFHTEFKAVMTGSMEPELPVGSLLVIIPAEYDDIAIGDDITYVRDEQLTLVTHRVISKDEENRRITTQGIANNTPDASTSYDNVLGKVRMSIPLIGYAVIWLSTASGIITVVTVAVALAVLFVLIKYVFKKPQPEELSESDNEQNEDRSE